MLNKMLFKKLILGSALVLSPNLFGSIVLIDSFNEGTIATSQTGIGSNFDTDSGLGSVAGGFRISRAHVTAGSGSNDINNTDTATPGVFTWNNDAAATGHFHLYYGYSVFNPAFGADIEQTNAAHSFSDMNLNLVSAGPANDRIRISVISSDLSGPIRINMVSNRTGTVSMVTQTVNLPAAVGLGGPASPFNLDFFFSGFTVVSGGTFDFADVDQVTIEAATDLTSVDWRLDQVSAVPEPSVLAPALLGLGAMVLRRRRR